MNFQRVRIQRIVYNPVHCLTCAYQTFQLFEINLNAHVLKFTIKIVIVKSYSNREKYLKLTTIYKKFCKFYNQVEKSRFWKWCSLIKIHCVWKYRMRAINPCNYFFNEETVVCENDLKLPLLTFIAALPINMPGTPLAFR